MIEGIQGKINGIVNDFVQTYVGAASKNAGGKPDVRTVPEPSKIPAAEYSASQPTEAAQSRSDEVKAAVEEVRREMDRVKAPFTLSIDPDTNRVLIKFKDPHSGRVVRQVPAEEIVNMSKQLNKLRGALLDSQG